MGVYETWGTTTIPPNGANQMSRYGCHWNLVVATPGFKNCHAIWAAVKPRAVLYYKQNGIDAWANARTEEAECPFFSPDDQWVGFTT